MSKPPDQRRFEADLEDGPFLAGMAAGRWGRPDASLVETVAWPKAVLWVAAAPRKDSPDKFHLLLDCEGYPSQSPTGSFWDPAIRQQLASANWPKGKGQVAAVFRPGGAFYHPYDRVSASGHKDWPAKYPHLLWDGTRTIVDFLGVIHGLLNSTDYTGV
jgi:hypothetical protein